MPNIFAKDPDYCYLIIMTDHIHHIEETLSHHEQQIQDLSDMVARQWQEIDLLKKAIRALQEKMGSFSLGAEKTGSENLSVTEQALRDKPPHY